MADFASKAAFFKEVLNTIPDWYQHRNPGVVKPLVDIIANFNEGITPTNDMVVKFLKMILHIQELMLLMREEEFQTATFDNYIQTIHGERVVVVQPLRDIIEKLQNGTPITMDTKIDVMRQMCSVMDTENVLWTQIFNMLTAVDVQV